MKTIWANTLVQNEERYIWYAVRSIIDHIDKMLVWDTGSTDKTVEIIKKLQKKYPKKIELREIGKVDINQFTSVRQQMLEETKSDWLIILDGDEVWWEDSIIKIVNLIQEKGDELETIVNPYFNIVGDIYHYQGEDAGRYKIDDKKGHITIRAMNRNIPGLHLEKPHGIQGFFDKDGKLIQNRPKEKRVHVDAPFMHFTHMIRSGSLDLDLKVPKRNLKHKVELGKEFPLDFHYPEVFFKPRPQIVFTPWGKMSRGYYLKALFYTPLKKIKRRMFVGKIGY